jgi:DNA polymerase III delta' subunit
MRTRGHGIAVAAVTRWIEHERPPHALLLDGPDGSGKATLALDLAAGLLCLDADPQARPCRACAACRKVDHGNHPDLHRLAPEGAGDQIRLGAIQGLTAQLALLPMEGRTRVALIEDAHRLNPDAQNALLKVLEEPVGAACIILAADDAASLLPTVLSRVARLRLGKVPAPVIAGLLAERGVTDPGRANGLALFADGRPGIAIALSSQPEWAIVQARLARQLLDLLGADARTRLGAIADLVVAGAALDAALRAGGGAASEPVMDDDQHPGRDGRSAAGRAPRRAAGAGATRPQPAERRRAALRVIATWRDVGRDLAVVVHGGRRQVRQLDMLEELEAAAAGLDVAEMIAFLERMDRLGAAIEEYANPELVLDALVLAWPRAAGAA